MVIACTKDVCEETKLEIRLSGKNNNYLRKRISRA